MKQTKLSLSKIVVGMFCLLLTASVFAADVLYQDAGSWLQIVGEGSLQFIGPKLAKGRVWLEGQSRFDNDWNHWYQGMVRAAVGYSLNDHATIWAGYTWLPTQNLGKAYVSQQDVWPAFRYILPASYGTWMFRTMVETNFLRGMSFLSAQTPPISAGNPASTKTGLLPVSAGRLIQTSGWRQAILTNIWKMPRNV